MVFAGLLPCQVFVVSILRGGPFEIKYLFLSNFSVYSFVYVNTGYPFPVVFRRLSPFIVIIDFDAHIVQAWPVGTSLLGPTPVSAC